MRETVTIRLPVPKSGGLTCLVSATKEQLDKLNEYHANGNSDKWHELASEIYIINSMN